MTWTCNQVEAQLSDYLEGQINGPEQAAFEAHVASCPECAPLLASVRSMMNEMRAMKELEAPPRLVYSILDKTLGPRDAASELRGWKGFLRWLASPKLAYGMASVAATLLIVLGASGFSMSKPKLADLRPANVYHNADRQAHLVYARSVKYVNDLRVVYEIQSRLRQDQSDLQLAPEESLPKSAPEKEPGRTDDHKPAQPKQQNRANELERQLELLAAECPVVFERSIR